MSHNPTYRDFSFKNDPKKIEAEIAHFVRYACWQEGGSLAPIKWMENKIFNSYEEAEEWLDKTDNGWYDNRAVVYLDTSAYYKPSKKLEDIARRIKEWRQRRDDINNSYHFAEAKASLIGCRSCGSKIAVEYMRKRNNCPVCAKSMLSDTKLKQLERANNMLTQLQKDYDAEKIAIHNKLLNKAEKRWLVYFDYHT